MFRVLGVYNFALPPKNCRRLKWMVPNVYLRRVDFGGPWSWPQQRTDGFCAGPQVLVWNNWPSFSIFIGSVFDMFFISRLFIRSLLHLQFIKGMHEQPWLTENKRQIKKQVSLFQVETRTPEAVESHFQLPLWSRWLKVYTFSGWVLKCVTLKKIPTIVLL